jgi:hypothetical protein
LNLAGGGGIVGVFEEISLMFESGIAVILSHIQVLCDAPVEIIPGYTL